MAMSNPYAAYQKFAKKKGPVAELSAESSQKDAPDAAPAAGSPAGPAMAGQPLATVREDFQAPRQQVQNPPLYRMKKQLDWEREEGSGEKRPASPESAEGAVAARLPAEKKPVNPYLQSKVMTASPEELVLMLYEGAIRFMNQAVVHLEADNKASAHESSLRAQAIVAELMGGLNMELEIGKNLMSLYDYLQYVMVGANIEKDVDKARHAIELLRELRETWQEAMKIHKASK